MIRIKSHDRFVPLFCSHQSRYHLQFFAVCVKLLDFFSSASSLGPKLTSKCALSPLFFSFMLAVITVKSEIVHLGEKWLFRVPFSLTFALNNRRFRISNWLLDLPCSICLFELVV